MTTKTIRMMKAFGLSSTWFNTTELSLHGRSENRYSYFAGVVRDARRKLACRAGETLGTQTKCERERSLGAPSVTVSAALQQAVAAVELRSDNEGAASVATALLRSFRCRAFVASVPFGDYFTVREAAGKISYCPRNRVQTVSESGKWERKGRQEITFSKFAKAILRSPGRFADHEYAAFGAAMGAQEEAEKLTWVLAETAEEIDAAYNARNWGQSSSGEDPSNVVSCMWGERVGEFYHTAGTRVLVALRQGLHVVRAVVWPDAELHLSGMRQVITLVDRIYTATPELLEATTAELQSRGWFKKTRESNQCTNWIAPDGAVSCQRVTFRLRGDVSDVGFFPYMDTLRYGDSNTLGTVDMGKDDTPLIYGSTNGDREDRSDDHDGEVRDVNGEWIDESEAVEVGGVYYHQDNDDVVYTVEEEYALRSDCYEVTLGRRRGTVYVHEDNVSRA